MIRWHGLVAGLLVFCAAGSAFAQDSGGANKKIKLGLRLGYGLPMGKGVDGGPDISDAISGQIPIWLDAGYMVTPNLLLGLYGQYGFALTKNCADGASCSAHDLRFGAQGQYHFTPGGTDPWLGLGIGYESLSQTESGGGASLGSGAHGWEFLNIQGGVDFPVSDAFTLGPFLSFSIDEYTGVSVNESGVPGVPDVDSSADISSKTIHEWLTLGAKGTFGL